MNTIPAKKVDPVEALGTMYFELRKAKDFLLQLKELSTYGTIFNEGERGSIEQMLKTIDFRMNFIREIQISL